MVVERLADWLATNRDGLLLGLGVALALVVCVVARFAYESVFVPWVTGGLAPGHASESLLRRAQYLTFTDWSRLLFLVVPSGIVTLAALLAVRRQDTW